MKEERRKFERAKLTREIFNDAAERYLEGTNLLRALKSIRLDTEESGCIKEHVVKNIATMLRTAMDMTPDASVKEKVQMMLTWLEVQSL